MDFQGGSDSDVAEEFDEEYSSSEDEEGGEKGKPFINIYKLAPTPKKEKPKSTKTVKDGPSKKKAKKDPNAPKKPLTSFIIFSSDKRSEIVNANPGMSIGDVAKQLGSLWKEISASEKTKYEELAKKDKERYERDMSLYKKGEVESKPSKPESVKSSKPDSTKFKSEEVIDSDSN